MDRNSSVDLDRPANIPMRPSLAGKHKHTQKLKPKVKQRLTQKLMQKQEQDGQKQNTGQSQRLEQHQTKECEAKSTAGQANVVPRKRGRPRKYPPKETPLPSPGDPLRVPKKRGRPRKVRPVNESDTSRQHKLPIVKADKETAWSCPRSGWLGEPAPSGTKAEEDIQQDDIKYDRYSEDEHGLSFNPHQDHPRCPFAAHNNDNSSSELVKCEDVTFPRPSA